MILIFGLLFLYSIISLFIGLVNPKKVIRWGKEENKDRKNVLKYYGLAILVSFIMIMVTAGGSNKVEEEPKEVAKVEQPAKIVEVPKVEEKDFELTDAYQRILKMDYADLTNFEIKKLDEIKSKYKELNPELIEEVQASIDRLDTEKPIVEEAREAERLIKEAEAEAKAEEDRIEAEKKAEDDRIKAEKEAIEREKAEKEKYNTGITVKDMARDKEGLSGSYVKFKGKILQVMEGSGYNQYRMAVNSDYKQVILIEILDYLLDSNILEDDIITIEGVSFGNYTYKTVLGAEQSVPGVIVDKVYLH